MGFDRRRSNHRSSRPARRSSSARDEAAAYCGFRRKWRSSSPSAFARNVRELEGALRRVIANSRFTGQPITVEFAKDALRDLLSLQAKLVTIENIQKTVADYFKVRVSDLLSERRNRSIARPRQVAMALAKELTTPQPAGDRRCLRRARPHHRDPRLQAASRSCATPKISGSARTILNLLRTLTDMMCDTGCGWCLGRIASYPAFDLQRAHESGIRPVSWTFRSPVRKSMIL